MCYSFLYHHVELHASSESLLESGEQRYMKATNNTSKFMYYTTDHEGISVEG